MAFDDEDAPEEYNEGYAERNSAPISNLLSNLKGMMPSVNGDASQASEDASQASEDAYQQMRDRVNMQLNPNKQGPQQSSDLSAAEKQYYGNMMGGVLGSVSPVSGDLMTAASVPDTAATAAIRQAADAAAVAPDATQQGVGMTQQALSRAVTQQTANANALRALRYQKLQNMMNK